MMIDSDAAGHDRPRGQRLLTRYAGLRERVIDDHMFTVEWHGSVASFRLQLFTSPGLRPVAVVTQTNQEGVSLVNRAERYVEAVWARCCPDEPEPPIWIQHQLIGERDFAFRHVGFTVTGRYTVASPPHFGGGLTEAELGALVGGPVDADRGAGYVPRPEEPQPQMRYTTTLVALLPRPDLDDDARACMRTGLGWWHRLARQVVPRRTGRGCCWYHGGNWHTVTATAIALVERAQRAGVDVDDIAFHVLEQARAQGVTGWQAEALKSLFVEPIQPEREIGYTAGRHRAKAMMDAGVRQTLITRWDFPDTVR